MRSIPTALFALVFGAAATVPAFGIASVNVFGLKAPEEIEGFTLNDSTNFEKIRLTTLSDNNTETTARKYVSAWVPVLWGGGGTSRAEQVREPVRPEPRPQVQQRPQQVHRAPARPRFKCPEGYICEVR